MLFSRLLSLSVGFFGLFHGVNADVTLFVPGFDEQPLSASELKAADNGRTAWQIVAGQATGGLTPGFIGTATLVQGPDDVRLLYEESSGTTVEIFCDIQSTDLAFCTGERGFAATPAPLGAATPFVLQGGGPITTSATSGTDVLASSIIPSPAAAPMAAATTAAGSSPAVGSSSASVTASPTSADVVSALASATALSSLLNPPAVATSNGHAGHVPGQFVLAVVGLVLFAML